MATITASPSISTISYSGNSAISGTMSWTKPTVPSGATISSCKLTGTCVVNASSRQVAVTVNGTTVANKASSGNYNFEIDLGTSNNTTSVTVTATGSQKQASGTVSFSNLVYTVTYEEAAASKPTYTVTFEDWNGRVLKTEAVNEGGSATAPADPTRDGYRFIGWDISFNNVTSNLTVTARYEIEVFTVTFKDWDGTVLKIITDVKEGMGVVGPNAPTREGYRFIGWDKDYSYITEDLIVTAQYTINSYTVTFKDYDGTTLKTQEVNYGNAATAPSNPAREGYTFIGWDKDNSYITEDLTVTAQYTINSYTVVFKDYDGTTLKTETVNYGSNATAPNNPTREGYTFTGWDKAFINITSSITVTAQYEKDAEPEPTTPGSATLRPVSATQDSGYNNSWTNIANVYDTDTATNGTIVVTGTSQGGFVRKYVDTIFNFDVSILPPEAVITSATLTVRCKSSATTNLYLTVNVNGDDSVRVIDNVLMGSTSTKDYTGDITSYVKNLNYLNLNLTTAGSSSRTYTCYDIRIDLDYLHYGNTYTVTFKDWDGTVLKTQTVNEGNNATAPSNPIREGYTFTGWDIGFNNVTSDLTVTAQYEIIPVEPEEPDDDEKESNLYMGDVIVDNLYIGDMEIIAIYIGDQKIF